MKKFCVLKKTRKDKNITILSVTKFSLRNKRYLLTL